ncbi:MULTISPECIES: hypothetical protein [Staphylococcus]|uniref:Uncharacterized protein n=1 Tax=Staphylococcus lugdunensis TaxID=28035 RepID=A0A292DJH2_STALU|nr:MULTISPECIES: hypothetical protein [Staphylococcus]ARB79002.1 hypothetical protein A6J61_12060 [Staphylococcus lugdunensis]ARJ08196.1 hypothetical protein B7454_02025 [Staphylococcus lugdunensis]ARJ10431.1 hypothetical protein B7466_01205 [Staphylococcus lugdunensis]ARJ12973.1 hypothetical protein B7468_01190 [Staphylococcus lugdunensis]ARJ15289.1 hypothetical protein B6N54_01280 [Staphylococcus lugdunensis]
MFIISLLLIVIGITLMILSWLISHRTTSVDLREKLYLPGLCVCLIGCLCLIGFLINHSF